MILCVTLNPCVDKTLTVPSWRPGANVRGDSVQEVAGGKGNNVARALARLGRPARPALFLGGATGAHCERLLRENDGLDPIVAPIVASTRQILTVRSPDAPATAFFDPDPLITSEEAAGLLNAVQRELGNRTVTALTLSGSSPSLATHGAFSDLIAMARARRAPVALDTYGPALHALWGFWPEVLHLNRDEAAGFLGVEKASDEQVHGLLDQFVGRGVALAAVTDGPRPVLARWKGQRLFATPPTIEEINPVGSGDCLLAGLVDARLRGEEGPKALAWGIACASANAAAWDAGAIDPARVAELLPSVVVEADGPGPAPRGRQRHRVA